MTDSQMTEPDCNCNPDDYPPVPCQHKRSYSECMRAALASAQAEIAALKRPGYVSVPVEPTTAEDKLVEAGVFLCEHGLRGLAECDEFWDKQPYGTRLYYADGNFDYLHRSILRTAISILDKAMLAASGEGK